MPRAANIPVGSLEVNDKNNAFIDGNRPQTDSGIHNKLQNRLSNNVKRFSAFGSNNLQNKNDMIAKSEELAQVLVLDTTSNGNIVRSPYLYNPVMNTPKLSSPPEMDSKHKNSEKQENDSKSNNSNFLKISNFKNNQKNQNQIENTSKKSKNQEYSVGSSYKRSILYTCLGLVGFVSFDPLVNQGLKSLLQLKEDGLITNQWKSIPLPINACFYLFELKNGKEFRGGAKPHLSEVGPFCYDEYKDKIKLEWKDNRLSYKEKFRFNFRPEDSKSLDTVVEVLNYPLMVVVQLAKYLLKTLYLSFTSPIVMNLVVSLMKATDEKLIEQRTARELLEGRKLKLVDIFDNFANPLRDMGIPIPGIGVGFYMLNNASFGFTSLRQITEFGPFEVYTDTKDGHSVGEFYSFNNKRSLDGFKSPCNRLAGGDGVFFGDNFKGEQINVFNQHVCKTLTLYRNGTSYRTGAALKRFTASHDEFDANLSSNKCFCPKGRTKKQCTGMSDMAPCFGGVQLYLSYPHFLYSSVRQSEFEGLKPDPEKHQAEVVLEDRLGAPVYVSLSAQVNLHVEPFSYVSRFRRIRQVPYPMFWVNESLELAKPLELVAGIGSNALKFGSWIILASGLGAGTISAYRTQRRNNRIDRNDRSTN